MAVGFFKNPLVVSLVLGNITIAGVAYAAAPRLGIHRTTAVAAAIFRNTIGFFVWRLIANTLNKRKEEWPQEKVWIEKMQPLANITTFFITVMTTSKVVQLIAAKQGVQHSFIEIVGISTLCIQPAMLVAEFVKLHL